MRRILSAAVLAAAVAATAGCATAPPPTTDKAAAYYEKNKTLKPEVVSARMVGVLGDSFTAGSDETPGAEAGVGYVTPAVTAQGWGAQNFALGGTGYLNPGSDSRTPFAGQLPKVLAISPDVVIVGGGVNDARYAPADVQAAAADLYAAVRKGLPKAKLIVIGPVTPGGPDLYENVIPTRDAIKSAAVEAGATFIDPIEENWFPDKGNLVGPTGFHPNAAGYAALKAKLAPHLKSVAQALSGQKK